MLQADKGLTKTVFVTFINTVITLYKLSSWYVLSYVSLFNEHLVNFFNPLFSVLRLS